MPPSGYLECNGQSTSSYPELAALIGAKVPDLRGAFVRGFDHGRGVDSGRSFGSFQSDAGRNVFGNMYGVSNDYLSGGDGAFSAALIGWSNVATGGSSYVENYSFDASRVWGVNHTASEFRPVNVALLPCIRALP